MKMSITRALVELKTLNSRIESSIHSFVPVALVTGKNSPRGYKTTEEFENNVNSSYKSITDLIKRRGLIKGAIVKANAATDVIIGKEKLTIAQAIEKKNSIQYSKNFLQAISRQYTEVLNRSISIEMEVDLKLQKLLEASFGKEAKSKIEDCKNISDPFLELNKPKIIDPIKAKETIENLQNDILNFEGEVDFVLSEINAKTEIEIPD